MVIFHSFLYVYQRYSFPSFRLLFLLLLLRLRWRRFLRWRWRLWRRRFRRRRRHGRGVGGGVADALALQRHGDLFLGELRSRASTWFNKCKNHHLKWYVYMFFPYIYNFMYVCENDVYNNMSCLYPTHRYIYLSSPIHINIIYIYILYFVYLYLYLCLQDYTLEVNVQTILVQTCTCSWWISRQHNGSLIPWSRIFIAACYSQMCFSSGHQDSSSPGWNWKTQVSWILRQIWAPNTRPILDTLPDFF